MVGKILETEVLSDMRNTSTRQGLKIALLVVAVLTSSLAGCKMNLFKKKRSSRMHFRVTSIPETNHGRAVHAVIRSVTPQEFLTDSYEKMSDMAYSKPKADGVLRSFAIVPGQIKHVRLEKEREKAVGIYFLFSKPGEQWKLLLPQPIGRKYNLYLNKDSVEQK